MALPVYCHLGLILDEDGKKMSKRNRADALAKELCSRISSGQTTVEALLQQVTSGLREDGLDEAAVHRCCCWLQSVLPAENGGVPCR